MSNFSSLLTDFPSALVSSEIALLTILLIVIGFPEFRRLPVKARINTRRSRRNRP